MMLRSARCEALDATAIARCFNETFAAAENVVLIGGFEEPLYLPATAAAPAELRFTRDHAASALHEVSHWCIAGAERRRRPDFGYVYHPAPRSLSQQQAFLRSEVRAQALESLFAEAAGVAFHLSFDDLEDRYVALRAGFARAVARCRGRLLSTGAPPAAQRFLRALRLDRDEPAPSQSVL